MRRSGVGEGMVDAVDAPRLLGEPFDEGGAVADLAARLVERLALLGGQDQRQILDMGLHQRVPGLEQGGALGVGLRRRQGPKAASAASIAARVSAADHVGHGAERRAASPDR